MCTTPPPHFSSSVGLALPHWLTWGAWRWACGQMIVWTQLPHSPAFSELPLFGSSRPTTSNQSQPLSNKGIFIRLLWKYLQQSINYLIVLCFINIYFHDFFFSHLQLSKMKKKVYTKIMHIIKNIRRSYSHQSK